MTDGDADDMRIALDVLDDLLRKRERAPEGVLHTIGLKDAAYVANISVAQMRRLCAANPCGAPGGYGFRKSRDELWRVEVLPFLRTLSLGSVLRFRDIGVSRVLPAMA